jgi:hypothetical protein
MVACGVSAEKVLGLGMGYGIRLTLTATM